MMPAGPETNIHATAIVAGTLGILLVGSSGSGKSELGFRLINEARQRGWFGALVADDRVELSRHGEALVARRPETISGMIELRQGGIASVASVRRAVLDLAISPVGMTAERLPEENERHTVAFGLTLPLFRIPVHACAPLAMLEALTASRNDFKFA